MGQKDKQTIFPKETQFGDTMCKENVIQAPLGVKKAFLFVHPRKEKRRFIVFIYGGRPEMRLLRSLFI